jgi:hypothetical protein
MNFSLVFDSTGDSIPFQTVNNVSADVLCYYVDCLNARNLNKFNSVNSTGKSIDLAISKLHSTISECNEFIYELLDGYIETYNTEEYLDQRVLNKLHADWVNSQAVEYNILEKRKHYNSAQSELIHSFFSDDIPVAPLSSIIDKLNVRDPYNKINSDIHYLETLFKEVKFKVAEQNWIEFKNPFGKEILTNDISNFSLSFNHLGRTLYNKFVYFDNNLEFNDENSYNELLGFVSIKLEQHQTISLSSEYVNWCQHHNRVPSGNYLNIGNIPGLVEKLTDYRTIIFRNTLQNNTFSIQLNKGN